MRGESYLAKIDPDVGEVLRRIGSKQVRASGTVGGNIANGSPIGDTPPMLIALGSRLHLRHGETAREMALEDFFIGYGKQDRKPGELVWRVDVPKLNPDECFRAYKISRRYDQDISAILAAFKFALDGRRSNPCALPAGVWRRRLGGRRARRRLSRRLARYPKSWAPAIAALAEDFQPISDMRASAGYRLDMVQQLFAQGADGSGRHG